MSVATCPLGPSPLLQVAGFPLPGLHISHGIQVPHLLYPLTRQWASAFPHVLVIVNGGAVNIEVHISF